MLKRKVFKISSGAKFGKVVAFLRRQLGMDSGGGGGLGESGETVRGAEGLWCYVNQSFAPALDAEVGGLWKASYLHESTFFSSFHPHTALYLYYVADLGKMQCFKTDDQLVVSYCKSVAFG